MSDIEEYPRETDELQVFELRKNGIVVTEGVMVCLAPEGTRPATYVAATATDDGKTAVRVHGQAPGYWRVWAKSPDGAVVDCGPILVD